MDDIRSFTYRDYEVRTAVVEGESLFIVCDICAILGYRNAPIAVTHLPPSEKGIVYIKNPGSRQPTPLHAVNEDGLFQLIRISKSAGRHDFRRWLVTNVIPHMTIPKVYEIGSLAEPSYALPDPILRAKRWVVEEEERQALRREVERLNGGKAAESVTLSHNQTDGKDLVVISDSEGHIIDVVTSPIDASITSLESALSAMWEGLQRAARMIAEGRLDNVPIRVISTYPGAADLFRAEASDTAA
ncbi:BRO family protein [Mycobacterium gordonae]|nr:BRO family protein [Mycobacterium gordonae]